MITLSHALFQLIGLTANRVFYATLLPLRLCPKSFQEAARQSNALQLKLNVKASRVRNNGIITWHIVVGEFELFLNSWCPLVST